GAHHGREQHMGPDGAVGVVVHVAAADAERVVGDPDVVGTDAEREVDVAKGKHVLFFENQGLHGDISCDELLLRRHALLRRPLRMPMSRSGGMESSTTEALRMPQGTSRPSWVSSEATMGSVLASEVVSISAIRNSFQTST